MKAKKVRIDVLLVQKGMIESRNRAQRLVMAGEVSVNGQLVHKPAELFDMDCDVIIANKPKYVSRGGLKLEKAIKAYQDIKVNNSICADIGASTGGFTDCLLQNGANKVYAIDVGYGQIHQKLRNHPHVVVMERVNIKDITELPEEIDITTIDVSFISLRQVFPILKAWNTVKEMKVIALIKPQFEVGRRIAAAGKGVVRNEKHRKKAIQNIQHVASTMGFQIHDTCESPIKGPKGNIEYLLYLSYNPLLNNEG